MSDDYFTFYENVRKEGRVSLNLGHDSITFLCDALDQYIDSIEHYDCDESLDTELFKRRKICDKLFDMLNEAETAFSIKNSDGKVYSEGNEK